MITALLALTLLRRADADTSVRLPPSGAVEIDAPTSDVILHTIAGDAVTVRGGSIDVEGRTVQVSDGGSHHRGAGGTLDVGVPQSARVQISSISGTITVDGAPDRLEADNVNGAIHVDGGSGTLDLGSVAGAITVANFHGASLSIDATSDNVTVTNSSGTIEADNVNGDVVLRGVHSASVTASTIDGNLQFDGDLAAGGTYAFSSQNGDISLWLPPTVSARMRVSTLNGQLDTRIPGTTTGTDDNQNPATRRGGKHHDDNGERSFVVLYGSGAATVSVDAFNGTVTVRPRG